MDLPATASPWTRTGRHVEPAQHRQGDVQAERSQRHTAVGDYNRRVLSMRTSEILHIIIFILLNIFIIFLSGSTFLECLLDP